MDLLGLAILIAISVISSVKKSNDAKQQRAKRQQAAQPPVYHSQGGVAANAEKKPAEHKPLTGVPKQVDKKLNDWEDVICQLFGLESENEEKQPVKSKSSGTAAKGKKRKKSAPQNAKKSPAELPKQTLMEQRPDREQREAHTKVAASVKPLKNAFQNDEKCEHRIELNPNIQYSGQKQSAATQRVAMVKTDREDIIQGMIWSEILGKPKAYQRQAARFRR